MTAHIEEVNDGNFAKIVLGATGPVLVDFWAEWCGPCRTLAPIVEAIAEQYGDAARVYKLNVDDSPAVAQRYGIHAIPTLILLQDGAEKDRILGLASQEEISSMIDRYIRAALN